MASTKRRLHYNAGLCMGCHSCEVSCKMEHDLPAGVNRVRIVTEGPAFVKGNLKYIYHRVACAQCPKPPCLDVCPTGAIKKRPDGIVFVEPSLCTGCCTCAEACPYGAIEFHPRENTAEICNLCFERLDQGLAPFCVQHCMGGALFFGTKEEFKQRKQESAARGGKKS